MGENLAGSHDQFVSMMNEKAKALKLENTHFANGTGLHDSDHYSSAKDMAAYHRLQLERERSLICHYIYL